MFKRHQVLLSDWQIEYIQDTARRYDQSFSEILRIFLAEGMFYIVSLLCPEYRPKITGKELRDRIIKASQPSTVIGEKHKLVADIYFEARKAVEYRMQQLKKERDKD